MKKYRLSFIIATFNDENYILRCLESLKKYAPKNSEIVIVNDGSNDGTAEICEKFYHENDNVSYYYQRNKGVSSARNIGIKKARGEFITFIDADDYIVSCSFFNKFDRINSEIIMSNYYKNSKKIEIFIKGEKYNKKDIVRKYILGDDLNVVCSKIYNRSFLVNNSIFFPENIKIGEDAVFFGKCLNASNDLCIYADSFYVYWRNPFSTSSQPVKSLDDQNQLYLFKRKIMIKYLPDLQRKFNGKFFGDYMSSLRSATQYGSIFFKEMIKTLGAKPIFLKLEENMECTYRRKLQRYFIKKKLYYLLYIELKAEQNLLVRNK